MRPVLAIFLLFLVPSPAHSQANREKCVIYCGVQKNELSKDECERWDYLYCMKTISRLPSTGANDEIEWEISLPWRILASAVPILSFPCLNMDESSLTILCNEEMCNRSFRGFYFGISEVLRQQASPVQCSPADSSHVLFDTHLIALIIILALLTINLLNSLRSFKFKRRVKFLTGEQKDAEELEQERRLAQVQFYRMILLDIAATLLVILFAVSAELCVNKLEWSTENGQILAYHCSSREYIIMDLKLNILLPLKHNFNAIQIPFSLQMVRTNPYTRRIKCDFNFDVCGATSIKMLDILIKRAAERGLLVILSNNQFIGNGSALQPPLWYDSQYPERIVIDIWKTLINRYRHQWNVFAIDLKNEPNGDVTWGSSNRKTDWNKAAERMIDKLSDFKGLFLVDGINWGTDLSGAEKYPITTSCPSLNNRVIYTPHCNGPQVYYQPELTAKYLESDSFPNNLDSLYMDRFGFLSEKGYPVIIGEWAGDTDPSSKDLKWNDWIIEWLRKHCITNFIFWSLDPNSRFTIGLFDEYWITPNPRILELLDRLQPNPTKFEARNGKICITKGAFPEPHCRISFDKEDERTNSTNQGPTNVKAPSTPEKEHPADEATPSQTHSVQVASESGKDIATTTTSTLSTFSMDIACIADCDHCPGANGVACWDNAKKRDDRCRSQVRVGHDPRFQFSTKHGFTCYCCPMLLRETAAALSICFLAVAAELCVNKLEWSTANEQILVNGIPLLLKGVNYHGFQSEYYAPLGLRDQNLNDILDVIKKHNFNTIQIPFSLEMVRANPYTKRIDCELNPDLCGTTSIRMLDILIKRAAERGLLVVLSNNQFRGNEALNPPPLWYDSQYPERIVIDIWKTLIHRYRNQWNVFAFDLKNEPHGEPEENWGSTWGDSSRKTDWNKAAERMINKLSDFEGLYLVDGIDWGLDLSGAGEYPIKTSCSSLNNRVLYTAHCYGPEIHDEPELTAKAKYGPLNELDFLNTLDSLYMERFGFLAEKGLPVMIGEWAGATDPSSDDAKWIGWIIEWLRKRCITNFTSQIKIYWSLDPNAPFTEGLFDEHWITPNPRTLEILDRLQPNPTKFEARNGKICITKGAFPEPHCGIPTERKNESKERTEMVNSTPDKEHQVEEMRQKLDRMIILETVNMITRNRNNPATHRQDTNSEWERLALTLPRRMHPVREFTRELTDRHMEMKNAATFERLKRETDEARTPGDWDRIALQYKDMAASINILGKEAPEYGPIFDAIHKKSVEGFNSGDLNMAAEMYDDKVILFNMEHNQHYYGVHQIKQAVAAFIYTGNIEYKVISNNSTANMKTYGS
ncbi:hypothetical protein PRIPAC_85987, partial [Pristionchus pacificus]|uniref:Uncharacterized protein n=1 Tax=Pristionchus pacificus TaxID=54126 RepID=A0A2A6BSX3_PRIPA